MNFRKNFENDQLSLIQAKRGDFDNLYSIASDEEIWEQHPENDRWKKNKFLIFFDNGISNEFGMLIIYLKSKNEIIGSTRFYSFDPKDNAIRIGYTFIIKKYWGKEINFLIKDLMINYTFKFLDKIYFDIGTQNYRSRKAIDKIGAHLLKDNEDGKVVYKLIMKDYVNNECNKQ